MSRVRIPSAAFLKLLQRPVFMAYRFGRVQVQLSIRCAVAHQNERDCTMSSQFPQVFKSPQLSIYSRSSGSRHARTKIPRYLRDADQTLKVVYNWGRGRKKCCKGFRRVILAAISFFIFGVIGYAVGSKEVGGIDTGSIQGIALLIFIILTAFVLPAVLAFIGAMNMLSGCLIGLSDD